MKINVEITYDPLHDEWDATQNPIVLKPGISEIAWTVKLTEPAGAISFSTEPDFRGITFNKRDWPGTIPKGNSETWHTTINDDLPPYSETQHFHYTVNTLYTPTGAAVAEKKSWDPEVDERADPPPPVK
jgi:hypothetical protein